MENENANGQENENENEEQENENEEQENEEQENVDGEIVDNQEEEPPADEVDQSSSLDEEKILKRIYLGEFDDIPAITSKIVRIFTSSTFTGRWEHLITSLITTKCFDVRFESITFRHGGRAQYAHRDHLSATQGVLQGAARPRVSGGRHAMGRTRRVHRRPQDGRLVHARDRQLSALVSRAQFCRMAQLEITRYSIQLCSNPRL